MKLTRAVSVQRVRPPRRRVAWGIAVVLMAAAATLPLGAAQVDEVQLRAALTVNFAKFVTWPREAFASDTAPFRVAVLSDDALAAALEKLVRGRSVGGRAITVLRAVPADDLTQMQLLFLGDFDDRRMALMLDKLRGKPVLTVSETADFTRRGGMIGIVPTDETFRFEVNAAALKDASLQANAAMLSLAIGAGRSSGR